MNIPIELRNRFKEFITGRGGLYFKDHDLRDLEAAISQRRESLKFDSVLSYYSYLTASEKKEDELRELLNLLTINHTYFFRNEPQFEVLKDKVLPDLIRKKTVASYAIDKNKEPLRLRVWSAGCSTGEEPYTIAMIIKDCLGDAEDWQISIIATDVSTQSLDKAIRGVYGPNAVKLVNKETMRKYFTVSSDGRATSYLVKKEIKDMVSFGFQNLIDEDYPLNFDIIFCRNVVIYFDLETTIKVMNRFAASLEDDGYLFIGYSESLQFITERFRMVSWKEAIYYQKGGKPMTLVTEPVLAEPDDQVDGILQELSQAEFEADKETIKEEHVAQDARGIQDIIVQSIKAIHLKDYDQALGLIDQALEINKAAVEPYYLAAEIFVNKGNYSDAKERLKQALKVNSLFAPAHYLQGCILIEEQKLEEAKASLTKALYLDRNFSLAYFYLGFIYKSQGRIADSIREYRNTLKILSKSSFDDIIAFSGGFNTATLMNVCRDNIERLKLEQ
ncbi:MAG: tetratricopeptide repeat protein [Candidatus Omnitrophica bacterium]|nr:tetratricopeptide repeat protein [Candidatus Omnitrophota bacterium]